MTDRTPQRQFIEYLVRVNNPQALDQTVNMIGAALIQGSDGKYQKVDDCYVMRCLGDPKFIKFACEQQGYCEIVRER